MTYDTICNSCSNTCTINMKITENIQDQICQKCNKKELSVQHLTTNRFILKGSNWFGRGR